MVNSLSFELILIMMLAALFVVPLVCFYVADAFRNHKRNKELAHLPMWNKHMKCTSCDFPMWPPLRFISLFPNPIVPLRFERNYSGCSHCDYEIEVKVEVE